MQGVLFTFNHVLLPLARSSTWLKHFFKKVLDLVVCSHVFTEMGDVMYLRKVKVHLGTCLTQVKVERVALNRLR